MIFNLQTVENLKSKTKQGAINWSYIVVDIKINNI